MIMAQKQHWKIFWVDKMSFFPFQIIDTTVFFLRKKYITKHALKFLCILDFLDSQKIMKSRDVRKKCSNTMC